MSEPKSPRPVPRPPVAPTRATRAALPQPRRSMKADFDDGATMVSAPPQMHLVRPADVRPADVIPIATAAQRRSQSVPAIQPAAANPGAPLHLPGGPAPLHLPAHGSAAVAVQPAVPPAVREPTPAPRPTRPEPAPMVVTQPAPAPAPAAREATPTRPAPSPVVSGFVSPVYTPPAPGDRWAVFKKLGLGPRAELSKRSAKLMVSTYRLLGFIVLTIIVVVLIGYIATSAFYFVSDSWIQPLVVSPTDEKVLGLQAQVTQHQNERERLEAELRHIDRAIAVEQGYQAEFANAIRADLEGRTAALDRLRALARDYAGARERIQKSNRAYAAASSRKMSQEYSAGLIDRGDLLSGRFQLAQIANSSLTLAERQAEFETRAAALENEASALGAILSEQGGEDVLSYEVLRIKQEYDRSRLEAARAIEQREVLRSAIERQEGILAGLAQSPHLRALADGADVAFVPYDNLGNVSKGAPLYRCTLGMIICWESGKVLEILPGEVTNKHPHRDKVLRGQMVEIQIDRKGAREDVLFVGGKPLFF